jgi:ABC-type transport system involved in multi-copper enzyme maturation permease subunit
MSDIPENAALPRTSQLSGGVFARAPYQTWAMARLTMRNLVVSKRTILIVLLACVPIAVSLILRHVMPQETRRPPAHEIFTVVFAGLYTHFVILVTTIFYGASLLADERSDRTITFLLIRPVLPEVIVLGKFLAFVFGTCLILLASVGVTYFVFSGMDQDVLAFRETVPFREFARVVVLAVAAYGAVFTFCGSMFKRPVIFAFAYCFLWESILPYLPLFLQKITVMYYVKSLIPNWQSEGGILQVASDPATPERAVAVLLLVCAAFLILTAVTLRTKEYSFEKEKEL